MPRSPDPRNRPPHTQPRSAGGYRIDEEIARGGFGVVYRATHLESGSPLAVKVLNADLFSDPSSTLRFEREAGVVLALAHPNIVKTYHCGRLDDGRPYLAMELLAGESLEVRLRRSGKLPVEEALDILDALAGALSAVHARGIVHRDIKPSNVFLAEGRPEGRVVLLDFGIVKLLGGGGPSLTASRTTLGTIPFSAPEQMRGELIDTRADVYALAALTYAMLTGAPPFGSQVAAVLRQVHLHARPPKPSERAPVDPALDEPILAALSRDPSERPATAQAFAASVRAALRQAAPPPCALPPGVTARLAMAVFAEVRPAPGAPPGDDALLDALEASLPIVRAALSAAGLVTLNETARTLLAVSVEPPGAGLSARVIAAASEAYRRVLEGPGRSGVVEVGISVHAGALHFNESQALLPTGLMDARSWSVAGLRGVAASRDALGEASAGAEPLPGAAAYRRVC